MKNLILRHAEEKDLPELVRLFAEDELGATREVVSTPLNPRYIEAFQAITQDQNQALMVVTDPERVIGTCHLTFLPSLSFQGSWRLQLENIHVDRRLQGQGIGTWMLQQALKMGQERGCRIAQLTTNKKRTRAKGLYEKLGFVASHEGMKLYLREG